MNLRARGSLIRSEECCLLHSTHNQAGLQSIYLVEQADNSTAQGGLSLPLETGDRMPAPVQVPFGQTETTLAVHWTVKCVNTRDTGITYLNRVFIGIQRINICHIH